MATQIQKLLRQAPGQRQRLEAYNGRVAVVLGKLRMSSQHYQMRQIWALVAEI